MKTYFVTGATGAVGSAVVARLLMDPHARVLALIRAASSASAAERLDGTLAALGVAERTSTADARVRALVGDTELPRFGLSAADRDVLVANCSHIIHCAGAVHLRLPLAVAKSAAVDSARNVLELAHSLRSARRLAKIDVVSTVGVAGRKHRLLREDWVGADHRFHNTYERAKAEAEQLVHDAARAGLPVALHRPSMVVGDSRTGYTPHFQVFYFLIEFLSGRRAKGLFPDFGSARLDIVPADFVAEAIVRSSASSATNGKILHLCAGPQGAIPLRRLQAIVCERLRVCGEIVPEAHYVSRSLFRTIARGLRLFADAKSRAALDTLPVFLDYLDTDQAFDNTGTESWLRETGVAIPRTEEYLPRVLDFYFAAKGRERVTDAQPEAGAGQGHG